MGKGALHAKIEIDTYRHGGISWEELRCSDVTHMPSVNCTCICMHTHHTPH